MPSPNRCHWNLLGDVFPSLGRSGIEWTCGIYRPEGGWGEKLAKTSPIYPAFQKRRTGTASHGVDRRGIMPRPGVVPNDGNHATARSFSSTVPSAASNTPQPATASSSKLPPPPKNIGPPLPPPPTRKNGGKNTGEAGKRPFGNRNLSCIDRSPNLCLDKISSW